MNEAGTQQFARLSPEITPLGFGYYALALATLVGGPVALVGAGAYALTGSYVAAAAIGILIGVASGLLVTSGRYDAVKRAMDLTGAAIGILLLAPIMALTAVVVMIDSGRPVLFVQRRIGRDGVAFQIIKFRTMRHDAGSAWAQEGDDRVTRIGSFLRRHSLDELPQFFNVIRGEMSLVGPRPEMESYAQSFEGSVPGYSKRHSVKPGITGYAQACGRRDYDPSQIREILAMDRFYVEHHCPLMDLALIYRTALGLLLRRSVGR